MRTRARTDLYLLYNIAIFLASHDRRQNASSVVFWLFRAAWLLYPTHAASLPYGIASILCRKAFADKWYFCRFRIFIREKAKTYTQECPKHAFSLPKTIRRMVFDAISLTHFGWLHKIFAFYEKARIYYHLCQKMVVLAAKFSIFPQIVADFFAKPPKKLCFWFLSLSERFWE